MFLEELNPPEAASQYRKELEELYEKMRALPLSYAVLNYVELSLDLKTYLMATMTPKPYQNLQKSL